MNFVAALMRGIQLMPAIISGIETIFGKGNGKTKQEQAIDATSLVMNATNFITSKDIVDPDKFAEGQKQAIDGIVAMFNASIWSKK